MVAGPFMIPEVVIYFDNMILRGNRSTKESSNKIQAFNSPNFDPLAIFNVNLVVDWHRVLRYSTGPFRVFTDFDEKVSQMTISPFLNLNAIEQVMKNSSAVILCGYGMGNLPTGN